MTTAPQSYQQEWMVAGKLRRPNPGWNMLLFWRFTGPLDRAALLSALDLVVARHEILRSTHSYDAGRPVQTVHPARSLDVPVLDVSAAELDGLARAQHALCLDLEKGPVLQGVLARVTDEDHYLLLTVDHAVCDGWSVGVLKAELTAAYAGAVTGRGVRLWELPLQYRDFATAQRSASFDEQLDWWGSRLDPGALGLAAAVPSTVDGFRTAQHRLVIPAAVADRLRRLPGTLFMTLLAGVQGALAARSADGDVAVASLTAGRGKPELHRLIGMFANPVVVRTRVPAGTYGDLLRLVRAGVTAAHSRQDAPWPLVAQRTGVGAAEVWLNVAPPPSPTRFRGLTVDTDALPHDYAVDVPAEAWRGEALICNFVDTGTEVVGLFDYNARQLSTADVAGVAEDVLALLAAGPTGALPPPGSRPSLPISARK